MDMIFRCCIISIHSLRMEGDFTKLSGISATSSFQSTPSAWRETSDRPRYVIQHHKFQSTPSAWRETHAAHGTNTLHLFQSTPSAWRETVQLRYAAPTSSFQSTPSAWRETLIAISLHTPFVISIHSLRMEGDNLDTGQASIDRNFNPLPPHGGRPCPASIFLLVGIHFNPLPPHGGRQTPKLSANACAEHFNPLPPHGGRR